MSAHIQALSCFLHMLMAAIITLHQLMKRIHFLMHKTPDLIIHCD